MKEAETKKLQADNLKKAIEAEPKRDTAREKREY